MGIVKSSQSFLEKGVVPDFLIRFGIRRLLKDKLKNELKDGVEFGQERFIKLTNQLRASPIAVETQKANEQHYELPTEFFQLCLGKHLKYSSAYWKPATDHLDQAEEDMLRITGERADLADGQSILELGCGWGSLSLFMAKKFPYAKIVGVCNSKTQKEYIDSKAREQGLRNLEIIVCDMNIFESSKQFDRVVSVEMFEHMRNYEKLMEKISRFLKPGGKLFVHIFSHREHSYLYNEQEESDWIGRYFFTGGIMPSDHLLLYFQKDFQIDHHWRVSGIHYQKTAESWLRKMDKNKEQILPIFEKTYGPEYAKWWVYWRVFYMACAELWGYKNGTEWMVSHYRFIKK